MVSRVCRRERGGKGVKSVSKPQPQQCTQSVCVSSFLSPEKNLIVIVAHLLAQQFMHVQRDVCMCGGLSMSVCVCVRSCHEIVVPVGSAQAGCICRH